MDNLVRSELPCDRRSRLLYKRRFVCGAPLIPTERKKVMKKQRRSKEEANNRIDEEKAIL
jgi:hypothetical protein